MSRNFKRIQRAVDHIEANHQRCIDLNTLAEAACMSRHHFARKFKEKTGKTPMRCLVEARVACVKRKLTEASSNIAEISVACGFSSQSHMTRAFKTHTGQTPAAFQRRALSPPE